jgi:hypothetical protein
MLAQWLPQVGKGIVVQCTTYHLDSRSPIRVGDKLRGNDKGTEDPCFAKVSPGRLGPPLRYPSSPSSFAKATKEPATKEPATEGKQGRLRKRISCCFHPWLHHAFRDVK